MNPTWDPTNNRPKGRNSKKNIYFCFINYAEI